MTYPIAAGLVWLCLLFAMAAPLHAADPDAGTAEQPVPLTVHDRVLHEVSPLLFGQFLEDAGRPSKGDPGPEAGLIPGTDQLRPDVVEALRDMQAPIIRFPGGYLVEHDPEQFDYRAWLPGSIQPWETRTGLAPLDESLRRRFGLVQFYRLCQTLGSEPLVVVPTRPAYEGVWTIEQTAEFAAGLVAMAHFPTPEDAPERWRPWVKLRTEVGLIAPPNVRYWQIGNETWVIRRNTQERLGWDDTRWFGFQLELTNEISKAMRAVDPTITVIGDGMNGDYNRRIEAAEPGVDLLADHRYMPWNVQVFERDGRDIAVDTLSAEAFWHALVATPEFDEQGRSHWRWARGNDAHDLPMALTEWNWNGYGRGLHGHPRVEPEWAQAIGAAGFVHAIIRRGDRARLAMQSMMLGNSWDITAVRVAPGHDAFIKGTGRVTAFYSQHHGHQRLALDDRHVPTYTQPYRVQSIRPAATVMHIDALATRDAERVYVHLIHRSYAQPRALDIDLTALRPDDAESSNATLRLLLGRSDVDLGRAEFAALIQEVSTPVAIEAGHARFTLPPQCVAVLEVPARD